MSKNKPFRCDSSNICRLSFLMYNVRQSGHRSQHEVRLGTTLITSMVEYFRKMGMESIPTQGRQKQEHILRFAASVLHVFKDNCYYYYYLHTKYRQKLTRNSIIWQILWANNNCKSFSLLQSGGELLLLYMLRLLRYSQIIQYTSLQFYIQREAVTYGALPRETFNFKCVTMLDLR